MGFHRMYVEVVSVGPSQFIVEHYFRFPYFTEGVRHGLSKRNFSELTAIVLSYDVTTRVFQFGGV